MLRKIMFVLLLVALATCAFATTWDIRDGDWSSINTDPDNPFKFGYLTMSASPLALTLYTYSEALAAAWGDCGALAYYDVNVGPDPHGNIMLGTNESTVLQWNAVMDPHMILSGAASDGFKNAIAFTAPAAGNYKLNAVISGRSNNAAYGYSTCDTYLYVNGEQLGLSKEIRGEAQSADGIYGPAGDSPEAVYDNVLTLEAGDVVWVSWDCANDGQTCDVLGIEYSVETVDSVAVISGMVTDTDGNPLEGVVITTDAGGSAVTGDDGLYSINLSGSGDATVTAKKSGYVSAENNVSYAVGQTVGCDFALEVRGVRTYYINSDAGSDGDDGLTPGTAWETFVNVKDAVEAGDTVILSGEFGPATLSGISDVTFKASEDGVKFSSDPGYTSLLVTGCTDLVLDGFYVC